jgi:hypothetical protein
VDITWILETQHDVIGQMQPIAILADTIEFQVIVIATDFIDQYQAEQLLVDNDMVATLVIQAVDAGNHGSIVTAWLERAAIIDCYGHALAFAWPQDDSVRTEAQPGYEPILLGITVGTFQEDTAGIIERTEIMSAEVQFLQSRGVIGERQIERFCGVSWLD